MNQPARPDWVAAVAHHLHRRWHSVEPDQLEELAGELWLDDRLRELEPSVAAEAWLAPVYVR